MATNSRYKIALSIMGLCTLGIWLGYIKLKSIKNMDVVDRIFTRRGVLESEWVQYFSFVPHHILHCDDLFKDRNKSSGYIYPEPYQSLIQEHATFTSKYKITEGYSYNYMEENMVMYELARLSFVKTICETGFNAGHSSLLWLSAKPDTQLFSFDLAGHKYTKPIAAWFQEKFGSRFHIEWGNSQQTVANFHGRYPNISCDLMIVDGGHFYAAALADMANFYKMASPDNIVFLDNYPIKNTKFMKELGKVWEEQKRTGKVSEVFNCLYKPKPPKGARQGFSVGRFNKQSKIDLGE